MQHPLGTTSLIQWCTSFPESIFSNKVGMQGSISPTSLSAASKCADSKRVKRQSSLFALLGSALGKREEKLLSSLTLLSLYQFE